MSLTKLNNAYITTLVYQTMATVIAQLDPAQLETLIEVKCAEALAHLPGDHRRQAKLQRDRVLWRVAGFHQRGLLRTVQVFRVANLG